MHRQKPARTPAGRTAARAQPRDPASLSATAALLLCAAIAGCGTGDDLLSRAPTSASTQLVAAEADSYVNARSADRNYGTRDQLRIDGSPQNRAYMRFSVPSGDTVTKALLRVRAESASSAGAALKLVSDNSWQEETITYANAPAPASSALASVASIASNTWLAFDVTSAVSAGKVVSFALETSGSRAVRLASREKPSVAPHLAITTSSSSTATCGDGTCDSSESCQSCAADCTCSTTTETLDVRVTQSSDDAEEDAPDGSVSLSSSDLEMTMESVQQIVGMRFASVAIPTGATITSAYIQFTADESQSETTALTIRGQAADTPATFSHTTYSVSGRTKTSASVSWSPGPWTQGDATTTQRTPELKAIVQEIVDRKGWSKGNPMAFIITGTGKRVADSFDGDANTAPKLHVELSTQPLVCGDGTCNGSETCNSCPGDCGACPAPTSGKVALPLEVIGPKGYTKKASFELTSATGIDKLYLLGHSLGYTDGLSSLSGKTKASVRLNGGVWHPINNATATVYEPEKSYGGIGGGFHTVRLTLPISGAFAGTNTIEFRFEGTDGATSGYRIIDFNLLAGSTKMIAATEFSQTDPASWTAPDPAGISTGKDLWHKRDILKEPDGTAFTAACADCHTQDGRDLKYFNYSNWSIKYRAQFHGLTAKQGEQIASYIRSLTTPAPKSARPWTPVYQPGPGLDAKPVAEWAAGAGLSAVLPNESKMLGYLKPSGKTWADVTSSKATHNVRQTPVAVQFPDWNSWLPWIHPVDVWGSYWTSSNARQAYVDLRKNLPSLVSSPSTSLLSAVGDLDDEARKFISAGRTDSTGGGNWRTQNGTTIDKIGSGISRELAKRALVHWMAVKHFEVMQEFKLEGLAATILPAKNGVTRGETRAWPSDGQSVWPIAPHMTADNKETFSGQSKLVGRYFSSVWYQLQMTVNAGMRQPANTRPMDWSYHFRHMRLLAQSSGQKQSLRFMQSEIKAYQQRDNGLGPESHGWQLRFLNPWHVYSDNDADTTFFDTLDTYQSGLRNAILRAMLGSYLDVVAQSEFSLSSWPRRSPSDYSTKSYWYALESASYKPTAYSGSGKYFEQPYYNHADAFFRLIPLLKKQLGNVSEIDQLVAWCKKAWPNGAWDTL